MVMNEEGIDGRKVQLKIIYENRNRYGGIWFSAKAIPGTFQMPYAQCCTKKGLADWLFANVGIPEGGNIMVMGWRKGYFKNPGKNGKQRLRSWMIAWMELLPPEYGSGEDYRIGRSNLSRISKMKFWKGG